MDNDSLLLGRIKEIHKYKLVISLPHNKTGFCPISAISEEYNSYLSRLVNDDSVQNDVAELKTLFKKGQLVQVKLNKSLNTNKFDLSLMPSAINSNVNIRKLKSGVKLQVAVKSREDKGYILETGIGGLNAFLPFENCLIEKYEIGQIIDAFPILSDKDKVGTGSRVINFSTKMTLSPSNQTDFDSILPGMLIKAVMKLTSQGTLEGKFNGFPVTVHASHHKNTEQVSTEQILCVIGVDCALKQLDCSILPHLRPPFKGSEDLLNIQIGHSEKSCVIKKMEKSNVVLQIPGLKFASGLISKGHIDSGLRKIEGNTVTARYLDYNLLDNIVHVTTLARLLSQSYFSINQAKLGEIIKGTIKKFSKSGYTVQISSQLIGLIPIPHLSDKPIHNPNSTYKSGDSIQCRVFHVDLEENRLLLTVKKSLMNSSLPVISCFDDLKIDMILNGYVTKIMEFGLVVGLFSNMRGWVPISRIPESQQKSLSVSFYVGKPLEVKVLRWNESTNKIELSLKLDESGEEIEESSNVKVGDIYEAEIKQTKPDGFNVKLLKINKTAFLPTIQLSDSREHRDLLQAHFTINGDSKISVVVISATKNGIVVSKKGSLVSAAESGRLLTGVANVTVNSQWLGWISKKESYGLFIELPSGVKGLVRNKDICDFKPPKIEPGHFFQVGDTVQVKVIEMDQSRSNKCLFSLKMSDNYRAMEHMNIGAIDFMSNHLDERRFIKSTPMCKKVQNIEIGDLVSVEITKQCEWGYTVKLTDESMGQVAGFVRNQHLPKQPITEASIHQAVIIDIDLNQQSIEVTLEGSLVNAVKNRKNHCTKIDIDQNIQSDVLFFNNDYVVAALKGHGHGNMVYIPTKRFWNDVTREFVWIINQRNPTIIKTVMPTEIFIGSLAINEAIKSVEDCRANKSSQSSIHNNRLFKDLSKKIKIKKGDQYPVYFHSITKNKLFVFISQRQKGFCNLIEYSSCLNELEQLMACPPERCSLMEKQFKVTKFNKESGLVSGHFLLKDSIDINDLVCCKVLSSTNKYKYRLKLPFELTGLMDLTKKNQSSLSIRVGNVIQCRVNNVSTNNKIVLSIVDSDRMSRVDNDGDVDGDEDSVSSDVDKEHCENDEQMDVDEEQEEDEENDEENDDSDEGNSDESDDDEGEEEEEDGEEMPEIITINKSEKTKDNLTNIYKRVHKSDDEQVSSEDDEEPSGKPTASKKVKLAKISNVERELLIRKAESRRETGENMTNPTNEAEYELLLFNKPNDCNSWIKYMKFTMDKAEPVDKVRSIAERAMKSLSVRDTDSRFRLMKEYIDLEIDQLVASVDGPNYDNQLIRFRKLFDRGLTQKAKQFYNHVCEKLIDRKLFELSEDVAKRFIKEFHYDTSSWFQLYLNRFLQKKFPVVKETLINAERTLKAADFRDLSIRVAQTEIERGDIDRGVQQLIALCQNRPKDGSLKNRIISIFDKNNLSQHVAKLGALATEN